MGRQSIIAKASSPLQVFDICIFCAMYEEAEAVLNEFAARCSVSFENAFSQMSRYA
jgi:hypothetical protein